MDKINFTKNTSQERQLKEQEAQYRELVEALNVGVYRTTAENKKFLQANPATANILGYDSLKEFMQTTMCEHYQNPKQRGEVLERLRQDGQCKNLEIPMLKKDGTPIWVSFNATAKYEETSKTEHPDSNDPPAADQDHAISPSSQVKRKIKWIDGVLEDITERKEAVNKLKRLNEAYQRFVPHEFLKTLGKTSIEEVQLNDRIQKEMTILFSDIRLFSTLSETMTPEENFKFINSYLSHMGPLVREHHGFIDKFIGDSIMALFGRGADDAVTAAIIMLKKLIEYNEGRKRAGYRPIKIGIGINTGTLMLGTVGEAGRMEGTVISDAVNAAARLEKMTKRYNTPLLISEHTFHALKRPSDFAIRFVDRVLVKGRTEPISIYEVFNADPPELFESKRCNNALFETAMYYFHYHDIKRAQTLLHSFSQKAPEDPIVKRYHSKDGKDSQFSPWTNSSTLELKKHLTCDLPVIDEHHKEMFSLSYELMETVKQSQDRAKFIQIMTSLKKTTIEHFKVEEKMMRQAVYPGYEAHKALHMEFRNNSNYIIEMASQTDYAQKPQALHLLLRIETLFVEWLANHDITTDKHFIGFMLGFR